MGSFGRFFGRPRGRFFSTRDEYRRIDRDIELHQQVFGTEVDWYFLDHGDHGETLIDDIYDEGFVAAGKSFHGPTRIPVLSAVAAQGDEQGNDDGFSTLDRVVLRLAYEQARRAGLDLDLVANREDRLHDRFVYRRRVFDVEGIQSSGGFDVTTRPTTILVTGRQLRTDELYDSSKFQQYITAAVDSVRSRAVPIQPFPDEETYPT